MRMLMELSAQEVSAKTPEVAHCVYVGQDTRRFVVLAMESSSR